MLGDKQSFFCNVNNTFSIDIWNIYISKYWAECLYFQVLGCLQYGFIIIKIRALTFPWFDSVRGTLLPTITISILVMCVFIATIILYLRYIYLQSLHLQLINERFYSIVSANDKCTQIADHNSIIQRKVQADGCHAYASNKQMFLLAVKAQIVASAMKILGMSEVNGLPIVHCYPREPF